MSFYLSDSNFQIVIFNSCRLISVKFIWLNLIQAFINEENYFISIVSFVYKSKT